MSTSDFAEARLHLALDQVRLGHLQGALETLRELLGDEPDHASAHALLAIVLCSLKRLHAADHEAELAIRLDLEAPLVLAAATMVAIGARRFGEARQWIEIWLATSPEDAEPVLALGRLCRLEGQNREAVTHFERARALDPDDVDPLTSLGDTLFDLGEVAEAERLAREALQMSPGDTDALVLMGQVLLKRGDLEAAREHAWWALSNDPEDSGALALLTALKARSSFWLSLWWRYHHWMSVLGDTRALLVLMVAFVVYSFATIAARQNELPGLARLFDVFWLGLVAYTWIGPIWFQRALKKELQGVQLRQEF